MDRFEGTHALATTVAVLGWLSVVGGAVKIFTDYSAPFGVQIGVSAIISGVIFILFGSLSRIAVQCADAFMREVGAKRNAATPAARPATGPENTVSDVAALDGIFQNR